jgi:hypothetical protein
MAKGQRITALGRGGGPPGGEGTAHGPVDGIPAEIGHPHQRYPQLARKIRCRRGHIPEHQHRLALGPEPSHLRLDLGRQLLLELLEGSQRSHSVGTQGISLDHTHIPAARTLLKRHRPEGKLKKSGRQWGGEHKAPTGPPLMQGGEHRSHSRAVAKAVAAHTGVNQHGCSSGARIRVWR